MTQLSRLEAPNLDNLRFQQDLVDEARKRIIRYCPEWTEYNLSDPGITLIELFAWMTEAIIFRLNQVPLKNYIEFLRMVGVQLQPATAARTELTFYLSAPFPLRPSEPELTPIATVEKGLKVATTTQANGEEIIFTTDEPLQITYPQLAEVRTSTVFGTNCYVNKRINDFEAFASVPHAGDAFYLGFANNISGNILRLYFECDKNKATGIERANAPLVWSCYLGKDAENEEHWQPLLLGQGEERDTTGGFRNPEGSLTLYLPLDMPGVDLRGITNSENNQGLYWLRCQYVVDPVRPNNTYTGTPEIKEIRAEVLASTVRATNAVFVTNEELGRSNGDPGQSFKLKYDKILDFGDDEWVEVEERHGNEFAFEKWQKVENFSESDQHDRHFVVDTDHGEIRFGPGIRQADGTMRQYGRIPPLGSRIRVNQYRYSGGARGNVDKEKINIMHAAQPYIDHALNLKKVENGSDQESVEEAIMRAQRLMRYQQRGVTPAEFDHLALGYEKTFAKGTLNERTIRVARAHCLAAEKGDPGRYQLLIIPDEVRPLSAEKRSRSIQAGRGSTSNTDEAIARAQEEARQIAFDRLALDNEFKKFLREHLDKSRLLTAPPPVIREPTYIGVRVAVEVVKDGKVDDFEVQKRVRDALLEYITPLLPLEKKSNYPNSYRDQERGWRFGQSLFVAELFSLVQRVPGVQHVLKITLKQRPIVPGQEYQSTLDDKEKIEQTVNDNKIQIAPDTMLCSLDHQVKIVTL